MEPSYSTSFVVLFRLTIVMLITFTQHIFAHTRSQVAPPNIADHKSRSQQDFDDDHKSRSTQHQDDHKSRSTHDSEDHKSHSQQHHLNSMAHHVLSSLHAFIRLIHSVFELSRTRKARQDLPRSQQDLRSTTLHVSFNLQAIIQAMRSVRCVFGLATSRPAPNLRHDLLPQSQQEDHKNTALHVCFYTNIVTAITSVVCRVSACARLRPAQEIHQDFLLHSQQEDLKTMTESLLPRLQAIIIAAASACHSLASAFAFTRLRPARKASHRSLPHSQHADFESMTLRVLPYQHILFTALKLAHYLLIYISSWRGHDDRQPDPQRDHSMTRPQRNRQASTFSLVASVAMLPRMHWIQDPAPYPMMQHLSQLANHHESAMAKA